MNPLKRVLGHIYFVYAIILFTATMLIVIIPIWMTTLFTEPRRSQYLQPIFRLWMGVYLPLVFCPVRRRGKQNFKKGENYVVVCNHNSLADIPVSSPWIPGPNKTLAKAEMAKTPLFGLIYKAGSILVDRKKANSRRESFTKMQEALQKGLHLCLYPEGTRNKTDQPLQPFYDGAFVTAIKAQKPIIPALIFNTGRILPHNINGWAQPMPIRIDFLEPISTEGLTADDAAELKDRVRTLMETYYVANRKK
ncbi:lysophospholipid acyltransferase family protein [Taibaiella soli]|uniref:1-acyl-sn-glycerol-3-phosphate acyltransferase n=1 Tax=Taibaiella soli TaxID=1649169 RepID=A0A2W2AG58_9BACT|nr:1-acyl-sn-glycerol-3-phosphate acyltransferase [Taibaiella soli]PZF71220.1 1-acyl-sn-glycerol-3-phosphate acyltransferase [Taibaiella soli]